MKAKKSKSKRKRFYAVAVYHRSRDSAIYRVYFRDGKVILTQLKGRINLDSVRLKSEPNFADHVVVDGDRLSTYKKELISRRCNHSISSVVGLFLTRGEAEEACNDQDIFTDKPIFREQTEAVKQAFIDNENCVFE